MSKSSNTSGSAPFLNAGYPVDWLGINARLSADQIIKGLSTAPRQPPSAPCVYSLAFYLRSFTASVAEIARGRSVSAAFLYRSEYGQVLDAVVTFANSMWTHAQKEKYENCRCTQHDMPPIKEFSDTQYKDARGYCRAYGPFHQMLIGVFEIISDTVQDITTSKSDLMKLERNPKKGSKWPSSPSKFVPNHAASTVSAFVAWARLIEHPIPIHVLSLLTFCCPSLTQAMFENEDLLPLTETLFSQFIGSVRYLNWKGVSSHRQDAIKLDINWLSLIFVGNWFAKLLAKDGIKKNMPSLTRIYDSLRDILVLLNTFGFTEQLKFRFGTAGGIIHLVINLWTSRPPHPHDVFIPYLQVLADGQYKPLVLWGYIRFLPKQSKCAYSPCLQTIESTKVNFKFCSNCRAVRYCSKECQTGDWKAHKPACEPLKTLLPIALPQGDSPLPLDPTGPIEESREELMDRFRKSGLTNAELCCVAQYVFSHWHARDLGEKPE